MWHDTIYFDRAHHRRMFSTTFEQNENAVCAINKAGDPRVERYYNLSNEHIESIKTTAQLILETDVSSNPLSIRDLIDVLDTQISEYRVYDNHFQNFMANDKRNQRKNLSNQEIL